MGEGYSSILVDGGTLYTMYRKADNEFVIALDAATGKTKWQSDYEDKPVGKGYKFDFGKGPNATPLVVGDRLFTVSFTAKLNCLDKNTGKILWTHDLMKEYGSKLQEFGYSASPIAHGNNIIVLVGGTDAGVMAFAQKDGHVAWKSDKLSISYASPLLINLDGQQQFVFMTTNQVVGLDPSNGKQLWNHDHANQFNNNCDMPIWSDDNVLIISSHGDAGGRALKLSQKDGKTDVKEVWANKKLNFFHSTALRVGDCAYGSVGGGAVSIYVGVDVKTGEILWKKRGMAEANSIYADGKVIILDEDGKLVLARVSPKEFTKLGESQICDKVAWTAPTLVGSKLYVRDKKKIMALDLGRS